MKKLRMIVTSVVVLAIVGGAFAFKTKIGKYCVRVATSNVGNCTAIKENFRFTTNTLAAEYYIYPLWDGVESHCTQDASGSCTDPNKFRLTLD